MNNSQCRSWGRMIGLIRDFDLGKIPYHQMVDQLEAALEEAEFEDPELVRGWYEFWSPLEEIDGDSSHDLDIDREKVRPLLERMRSFLWGQEKTMGHTRKWAHGH